MTKNFDFVQTQHKQTVLQFFQDHEEEEYSTSDLAKELDLAKSSVSRTLNDLESMGILDVKSEGKKKVYSMDTEMARRMNTAFENLQSTRKYALERKKEQLEEELEES